MQILCSVWEYISPSEHFLHSFLKRVLAVFPNLGTDYEKRLVWLLLDHMGSINLLPKMQKKHSPTIMILEEGGRISFFQPKTDKLSVIFYVSAQIFLVPFHWGDAIWACGLRRGLVELQFCLFHQFMVACLVATWTLKSKFWDYGDWPPVLCSPLTQGISLSL